MIVSNGDLFTDKKGNGNGFGSTTLTKRSSRGSEDEEKVALTGPNGRNLEMSSMA